jgi:nucleoid-associated protein YgaU
VSFELSLDGTGVVEAEVNGGSGAEPDDAKVQVDKLKAVVYSFDGNKHQPNYVKLVWGNFSFVGRLETLAVTYNLFKPTGQPLRAKVKMAFVGTTTPSDEAAAANKSSPDLSHLIEVKAGDTLPLLCYRVYKDSAYYLDVARVNGLVNFRSLTPGVHLMFPPLR